MARLLPHPPEHRLPFVLARLALVALALTLALAAGCGGSKDASDSSASAVPGATATPPATPEPTTPPPATTAPVATGAELGAQVFVKRCVLCHGPDGHGDGIASKGLNPKPRNFHDQAYMKTRTDAQLLEIIHKGKGAMPRWEGQLSDAEITAVLAHVRALGQKP